MRVDFRDAADFPQCGAISHSKIVRSSIGE